MINPTQFPPGSSSHLHPPAHSMPVVWVPVDSGHLTLLIVPIFFNMPSMGEGMMNVEGARSIETGEGVSPDKKDVDGKPASEEPMPEGEPADPKEISKEKIDLLARFIAKELIPEKLTNLTFVRPHHHQLTPPSQSSKDDKTAVEQAQKDPENSNLAVPKESVKSAADQPSYSKSPSTPVPTMEKDGMNEGAPVESLPEKNLKPSISIREALVEHENIDSQPSIKVAAVETTVHSNKGENAREEPKEGVRQVKILEGDHQPRKEESQAKEMKGSQGKELVEPSISPNTPFSSKDIGLPVFDPKKTLDEQTKKDRKASDAVSQVEANKHVKPRKDAIPTQDKNESLSIQQMHKFVDESLVARMPIMPDFPLSREAILRQAGTPKNARLREDQGYRLGDLVVMILAAVLGGAKNTSEVCRYLLSREKFFKVWMGIKNAMPTYRMLWFLLNKLEPKFLETLLQESIGLRPSRLMHTIHVWESHRGFTLGELIPLSPSRSPDLLIDVLDFIDSAGATVNVEAPVLNKAAARKIKLNGGEYILTLKGAVYEQAEEFLEDVQIPVDQYRDVIQDGAATFIREIKATEELAWFEEREEWPYLQSLVQLKSQSVQNHRVTLETKIYLSSLPMQADRIAQILRIFSVIEGQVSWIADFDFLAQGSKEFRENESMNIEILRHFSDEILAHDTNDSSSIEAKRKKVRENNDYLRYLILR
jgi:hypothetical protein